MDVQMNTSMWIYPWDILDAGAQSVMQELVELGMSHLSVATSYHAGRLLLPHNPKKKVYLLEDGVVYFRPHSQRYRATPLKPKRSSHFVSGDPLKEICAAAVKHNLKVNGWTVVFHNSRLGENYPHYTMKNVFGEHYTFALCPSHAETRHFAVRLAEDLTTHYPLETLELESIGFMSYEHRLHHDKSGTRVDGFRNFLLSLCFCSSCRFRMHAEGVNLEWLSKKILSELESYFDGDTPEAIDTHEAIQERLAELLTPDQLEKLLQMRDRTVCSLVDEIRQVIPKKTKLMVTAASSPFVAGAAPGVGVAKLSEVADSLLVSLPGGVLPKREIERTLELSRAQASVDAGLRAHWPDIQNEEELQEKIGYLKGLGIAGIHFYNYGLISRRNLEWIGRCLRQTDITGHQEAGPR